MSDPKLRTISESGLTLLKKFEGCRLTAYKCPAGIWTVGYGSTGSHVKEGTKISQSEADALLLHDVERFEVAVRKLCPITTQGQFDALVSFSFNLGENSLRESTLRRLHNEGKHPQAADQFPRWNKAGGRVLAGLTKRRAAERELYLS